LGTAHATPARPRNRSPIRLGVRFAICCRTSSARSFSQMHRQIAGPRHCAFHPSLNMAPADLSLPAYPVKSLGVWKWPTGEVSERPVGFRCWGKSGKHLLTVSSSACDPRRTKARFSPYKSDRAGTAGFLSASTVARLTFGLPNTRSSISSTARGNGFETQCPFIRATGGGPVAAACGRSRAVEI
jgi:hypothetical protein